MKVSIQYNEQNVNMEVDEDIKLDALILCSLIKFGKQGNADEFSLNYENRKFRGDFLKCFSLKEISIPDEATLKLILHTDPAMVTKCLNLFKSVSFKQKRAEQRSEIAAAWECYNIFKNFSNLPPARKRQMPDLERLHEQYRTDFGLFCVKYRELKSAKEAEQRAVSKKMKMWDNNLQKAFQEMPEAMFPAERLYIKVKLNGHEIYPLVDTGAMTSVITESVVRRVGLFDMVDTRFKGDVYGIGGKQKKLGAIPRCALEIEGRDILTNITVLPDGVKKMDMIIGIDLMFRHRVKMDLFARTMTFDDVVTTQFLNATLANQMDFVGEITVPRASGPKVPDGKNE